MVRINRIYTRTGDKGETGLVGGSRVSKSNIRIELLGEVDELNAHLGVLRTLFAKENYTRPLEMISRIQNELFDLGAEIATPPEAQRPGSLTTESAHVTRLENWIDELTEGIPELTSFVLPGGTDLNASAHIARTVCRRLERTLVRAHEMIGVSDPLLRYVNRLSDLLFAMARWISRETKQPEYLWVPGKDR